MKLTIGKIDFIKCESKYDSNLFLTGQGVNKIEEINIEALVETNANEDQLK